MHEIILQSVCEKDDRVHFVVYVNYLLDNVTATIESSIKIIEIKDKRDIRVNYMYPGLCHHSIEHRIFNMVRGMWKRMDNTPQ